MWSTLTKNQELAQYISLFCLMLPETLMDEFVKSLRHPLLHLDGLDGCANYSGCTVGNTLKCLAEKLTSIQPHRFSVPVV